jgi:hypothetical protein
MATPQPTTPNIASAAKATAGLFMACPPRGMAQNIASLSGSFSNMIEC